MILNIAIADENSEYIRRILDVLEGYEDLDISVFTDEDSLEEALKNRKFDVLLFDESICHNIVVEQKEMLSILLLDEDKGVGDAFVNFKKIHKYQRVSKIYQQILEVYSEMCGDIGSTVGKKKTTVVSFYSPIGGCGKTTTALLAACKYAMQGYRCLYLNMEDIASEGFFLTQNGTKGLSDIVANLGEKINFTMKLQSLLQTKQDNFYYFNHFQSPNDIYELSEDEEKDLLDVICDSGLFDVVIIDMGVSIDKKTLTIFELSDKIHIIEKIDMVSLEKMKCFLNQSHILNAYARKMSRTINFYRGKDSILQTEIPIIGKINVSQNPEPAQFIETIAKDSSSNYLLKLLQ